MNINNSIHQIKYELLEKYNYDFFKNCLEKIEILTGFKWEKENYKIYLFEGNFVNISYPICINISSKNINYILFNIIHELVHNNISNLWIFEDENQISYDPIDAEAIVNLIADKILSEYFNQNELNKIYMAKKGGGGNFSYKYVWKRVIELKSKVDLNKITLRYYVKNNEKYKIENE
ncbi:MAG: hypothetical protein ACOC3V_05475 [bacterium]